MVELDSWVETRGEIALVELVVRNPTATARRIRVGNRLTGPIWPPRREGVPEMGWDDGGFEGVVAAEGRRALGYASPVSSGESTSEPTAEPRVSPDESPLEPPVEIVWTERAGDSERPDPDATPDSVVRSLGDPRPPADAVPAPRSEQSETGPETVRNSGNARNSGSVRNSGSARDSETVRAPGTDPESPFPDSVESWLAAVEERADGNSEFPEPTSEDRRVLGAVARRIERLRGQTNDLRRPRSP